MAAVRQLLRIYVFREQIMIHFEAHTMMTILIFYFWSEVRYINVEAKVELHELVAMVENDCKIELVWGTERLQAVFFGSIFIENAMRKLLARNIERKHVPVTRIRHLCELEVITVNWRNVNGSDRGGCSKPIQKWYFISLNFWNVIKYFYRAMNVFSKVIHVFLLAIGATWSNLARRWTNPARK